MAAKKSRSRSASKPSQPKSPEAPAPSPEENASGGRWRLNVGLWGLLIWLGGGVALEALHAFKAPVYLDDSVRRELWTLAHAHGTLLSLACLAFYALEPRLVMSPAASRGADRLLALGALLLPAGFFLGGAWHPEGDPGAGILLTPLGALLFGAGVLLVILARGKPSQET